MENREHFRHILYFYFLKGKKASEAHRKLTAVYGDKALKERQCQKWFAKFRSGNFSFKNQHHIGRPVIFDEKQLGEIISGYHLSSTSHISQTLGVPLASVERRLKEIGYKKKMGVWIPSVIKKEV